MQKLATVIFIFLSTLNLFAQSRPDYAADSLSAPLRIPLILSGNFAELRPNHFHAGLDFKTEGQENVPIYAVADGYVSRIKISTGGYGKALYIDHPDLGYTTVYAHLNGFPPTIDSIIKAKHYELKEYNIDFTVEDNIVKVKKGELIAYSGNTGSSGGPHLHFEIRDRETQDPINPLFFGFDIEDTKPPSINGLRIYPISGEGSINYQCNDSKFFPIVYYSGKYHLKNNPTINAWGKIGFGVSTIDYLNGGWNKCGIFSIELYDNNNLVFKQEMDRISYSEMRYINAHIDYNTYLKSHAKYQYSFQAKPNNPLSIYKEMKNDGIIDFSDSTAHEICYIIKDTYGNTSELVFSVNSKPLDIDTCAQSTNLLHWNEAHRITTNQFQLIIPKNALYEDQEFTYNTTIDSQYLSPIIHIDNQQKLLNKKANICIRPYNNSTIPIDKMVICQIREDNKLDFVPTETKDDVLSANVYNFSSFTISCDTIAPTLKPVNIYNGKQFPTTATFGFKVSDDFSGLWDYSATIDGNWSLFYYEYKKDYIYYTIDPARLEKGKMHQLHFEAWDATNNKTECDIEFYW